MGLDMYLKAHSHFFIWSESKGPEKEQCAAILENAGLSAIVNKSHLGCDVSVTVAYWRKANAIHGWFVDHVQDGKDECKETYVTREQLQTLHDLAVETLKRYDAEDRYGAAELLKPREGFFFGSTEVDDYFRANLVDTIRQLAPLLDEDLHRRFTFTYRSSW